MRSKRIQKLELLYLKVIDENSNSLKHKRALYKLCNYVFQHKEEIHNLVSSSSIKLLNRISLRELMYNLKLYTFNLRDYKINMMHNENIQNNDRVELYELEQDIMTIVRML